METPDGGGRRCDGMKTGPSVPWPSILYLSLPATGIKGKEKEGIIGESLEWMINPLQMMDDGEQGREMDSWLRTFGSYHRSRSFFIFSFIFFCFYHVFLFSIHVGSPEIILEKRPVLYPIPSYLLPSFLIHCQDLTKGKAWEARKKTNCRFPNPFHSLSSFVIPLQIKETDECSGLSHHRSLAFAHSLIPRQLTDHHLPGFSRR